MRTASRTGDIGAVTISDMPRRIGESVVVAGTGSGRTGVVVASGWSIDGWRPERGVAAGCSTAGSGGRETAAGVAIGGLIVRSIESYADCEHAANTCCRNDSLTST